MIISLEKGSYCQVQTIDDWNDSEKKVHLKKFGMFVFLAEMQKLVSLLRSSR